MKWYENLYVGENAELRKNKIIHGVKKRKFLPDTFVITLPVSEGSTLETYPSAILVQKHYKDADMLVVGIAVGRDEALKTMESIIMDCYRATGSFDVGQFIGM